MAEEQRRTVVNAFESRDHAERALGGLREAGFKDEEIGWAMRHEEAPEGVSNAAEGAATGALTGGLLGGVGAAVATALIPGIGPFIGGGILATVLTGAGVGAAAGGLLGGLTGMGLSHDEAEFYDQEFKSGRPVMTVNAGDRHDEVRQVFQNSGGYDYESRRGGAGTVTRSETVTETVDDVRGRGGDVTETVRESSTTVLRPSDRDDR